MRLNLQAFGLALVAALTLGAIGGQAASAQDLFTSDTEKTVLTGTGSTEFTITSPHTGYTCESEIYSGTVSQKAVGEVTVNATYNECTSDLGALTYDMTSCAYILTGETTGKHGMETDATVSLECTTPGDHVDITGPSGCTFRVPAQTPTEGGVTYHHTADPTKHDVTLNVTATGLTYTSSFACQLVGFAKEANNTHLTGTVTVTGYEDKKEVSKHVFEEGPQVNITVTEAAE